MKNIYYIDIDLLKLLLLPIKAVSILEQVLTC